MTSTVLDVRPANWSTVEAAMGGDQAAFGRIYEAYHGTVLKFVMYRVGNKVIAEDLTADTFVRAMGRIGKFTWQGRDVGAWLVTIARNLVVDHFKSGRYRFEVLSPDSTGFGSTFNDHPSLAPEGRVEETILSADLATTLRDLIGQLGALQRTCIEHRFFEGLSVAETAVAMGCNEGAIKALQYRAVRALARLAPEGAL